MTMPSKLFMFLNIVMLCLLSVELGMLILNSEGLKKNNNLIFSNMSLSKNYIPSNMPDSSKPDIYFLLFDGYTNNRTLKEVWGFNNDGIAKWLASDHFYVPDNTSANYNFTLYSVSSTFKM